MFIDHFYCFDRLCIYIYENDIETFYEEGHLLQTLANFSIYFKYQSIYCLTTKYNYMVDLTCNLPTQSLDHMDASIKTFLAFSFL